MSITKNIEDYIKAIFNLTEEEGVKKLGNNQLAEYLGLSPASVSVMIKKMKDKKLVDYERYGKIELTQSGHEIALKLIRKHRLWETFLHDHMNFTWDEVHEVAHQLEHINSPKLIKELDNFLGNPKRDPHGDAIPDEQGRFVVESKQPLSSLLSGDVCRLISVKDNSAVFLKYVTQLGLALSSEIEILEIREFDASMLIAYDGKNENVSKKFAESIYVEKL
ncbi:metal-dependent transcriptional regulator [Lutimonas sp.]|uniref:metal-dependent transcriptional regulator n=1 Tax=Lutimonas sp. TaxID=1872403 RepID=UPI003D9AD706